MNMFVMIPTGDTIEIEIENTLAAFQAELQGYIHCVPVTPDAALVVHENAETLGMMLNRRASALARRNVYGVAILAGIDGEELTDSPRDLVLCAHALLPTHRCG